MDIACRDGAPDKAEDVLEPVPGAVGLVDQHRRADQGDQVVQVLSTTAAAPPPLVMACMHHSNVKTG